ncbi:TIGR00266 family protein [Spartinivicinus ruber]|uniref:TIGR00266 family protein n=1 Tax=Spartinivicinus ruber TaxID=2683272 RepID=UPI0013D597E1
MNQWYFSIDGKQSGPIDDAMAKVIVRENPGSYCWRQGFSDWLPVYEVPELRRMKKDGVTPFPPPPANMMSPKPTSLPQVAGQVSAPVSQSTVQSQPLAKSQPSNQTITQSTHASAGFGSAQHTEGIDYKIYGTETQFVELELDPKESAVAEAGAMMYKTSGVEMETIFGDGSQQQGSGFMNQLLGAGRRLITGESLFTTVFTQTGSGKGRVAFGAPFPGTILPIALSDYHGKLICQKDSFLAGAKGVEIGLHFQKKILTGLFGGEGFILQKLEGDGLVFVHMGGTVHKIELGVGETLHVDTGCLAAMTESVDYDIQRAGGIKTMLFGGEGFFFATLKGPGTVWLQSLPFSRLAGRMLAAAPGGGGRSQGEGSLLGGLGDIFGDSGR